MQAFKMHLLKSVLLLNALSLAACNLPSPQEKATSEKTQGAASFTVQVMADKSKALETTVQGTFALPTAKVFNYQVCIKDIAYDKPVAGHQFMVAELNKAYTTDKAGCLTWAESVSYNYLGESQFLRINRTIQGAGIHKGSQKVSFAINPWMHGDTGAAVLNPDDGNVIPRLVEQKDIAQASLKGYGANKELVTRQLWIEDSRLFVTEDKLTSNGVNLTVEMRPNKPAIQLTKMNGEIFPREIQTGTFKAVLKLIHTYQENGKEVRRIIGTSEEIKTSMQNASLAIRANMTLPVIPTRGQVMIGLQLDPVNGPEGLKGFEGVFFVGEYDQLKAATMLRVSSLVSQTKNFTVNSYANANVTDIKINSTTGKADADFYQAPKIEVAQLEFRYLHVGKETTSTREVYYNIKACVRNGLDQKSTRAQTFKITKFRQGDSEPAKTISVKTDNNACINWDETITFPYFDCQRYLTGYVQIENENLGMNEKLGVMINPWEAWSNIGRDMRYVDLSEKLVLSCNELNRPKTRVLLDNFNYNTLSYKYEVDENLNLTVKKKIKFRTEPHLLVYSSLANGRSESQRLRDGIYLLKTAIVQNKDYDTKNTYVASADALVNVMSGQIITDLTFTTQDIKALGNRNTLLVEVHPIDESKVELKDGALALKAGVATLDDVIDTKSSLENPTFMGAITLNVDEASRALTITDASAITPFLLSGEGRGIGKNNHIIAGIVADGLKLKAESLKNIRAKADIKNFAKENNLHILGVSSLVEKSPLVKSLGISSKLDDRLQLNKSDLKEIIKKGAVEGQLAQKLCAFWASDYMKKMYAEKGGALSDVMLSPLGHDCYAQVTKNPGRFFQVQKHMIIKEVGGSKFVKGLNQGLTVGTSFGMNANHATSFTRSTSIQAKVGISKKFMDLLSISADLAYTLNWSTSDGNSTANAVSVNTSTSMTVQQNTFKVKVNKYEQCAIVRLNPVLFLKDTKSWFARRDYLATLNPRLTEEETVNAVTRGLMLCDGEVTTTPTEITENFYLIAQETNSTQMQDNGDARNRNFFIGLRSTNDFNRFVVAMKGDLGMPATAVKEESIEVQTTKMMERLFELGGPTYPGMYLVK